LKKKKTRLTRMAVECNGNEEKAMPSNRRGRQLILVGVQNSAPSPLSDIHDSLKIISRPKLRMRNVSSQRVSLIELLCCEFCGRRSTPDEQCIKTKQAKITFTVAVTATTSFNKKCLR